MPEQSERAAQELAELKYRLDWLARELEQTRSRVAGLEQRLSPPKDATVPATTNPAVAPEVPPPLPESLPVPPAPRARALSSPPVAAAAAVPPAKTRLRDWLERLHLWPPQDGGDVESRLGAWWATRLGMLFAVIGAVFFGVYLSIGTPPWVKLAELVALAAGVLALGRWLEARWRRFAQVILAGGQALLFFAAFAAYTVPAVKVIMSPTVAAVWQLAVAGGICAAAWWRRSPGEATLATPLGFVAVGFSLSAGLDHFALLAAWLLAVVAVVWRRWLGWQAPSFLALAGYWAVAGCLVLWRGWAQDLALSTWVWLAVAGGYAVFVWRDDPLGRRAAGTRAEASTFQNANSSAALVVGGLTAWVLMPQRMELFYLGAAVVLGLAAWRRRMIDPQDLIGSVLLAKATGVAVLAVISWTEGRTTALALLVQAGVMLAVNRRLGSRVMRVGAGLVAGISLAFQSDALGGGRVSWDSWGAAMAAAYFAGAVAWLAAAARPSETGGWRRWGPVVAAMLGLATVWHTREPEGLPTQLVVAAAVLAGAAVWSRSSGWWVASGVLAALAHAGLWWVINASGSAVVAGNAAVVLLPSLLAVIQLGRRTDHGAGAAVAAAGFGAAAFTVMSATFVGWELLPEGIALGLSGGLSASLAVLAPRHPQRRGMWVAAFSILVGTAVFLRSELATQTLVSAVVALAVWIGLGVVQAWHRGAEQLRRESPRQGPQRMMVVAAVVLSVVAAVAGERGAVTGVAELAGFALVAMLLLLRVWIGALRIAAWTLWLLVAAALPLLPSGGDGWIVLAVVTAWIPLGVWRIRPNGLTQWEQSLPAAAGLAGLQSLVAGALTWMALVTRMDGAARVGGLIAVAVLAVVLRRNDFRLRSVVPWVLTVSAAWFSLTLLNSGAADRLGPAAGAVATTGLWLGALPLLLPLASRWRRGVVWAAAGAGLALEYGLAVAQMGRLQPYATVVWGVAALVWFGVGLAARSRPHRLIGLTGLLACVPRVFVVDLQSTLHRIVAFAVLGVVLLWVGFSYHRFRRWIADEPMDGSGGKG